MMKGKVKIPKLNRVTVVSVICALLGVILLVFTGGADTDTSDNAEYASVISYTEKLEDRVKTLCLAVDGVDEVSVLLTMESGSEFVYADNIKEDVNGQDSRSYTSDYLIIEKDDGTAPVVTCEIYPRIRGVAVVCNGGDKPALQKKLTELISAALGISSGRIRISA
ncbi:MAG: hypothetical protein IKV40_05230 [Clostridia bacterium]|nr:hypothetical protein [Clostridia bacterium]